MECVREGVLVEAGGLVPGLGEKLSLLGDYNPYEHRKAVLCDPDQAAAQQEDSTE